MDQEAINRDGDLRTLRLLDLAPYETIQVQCQCGRIGEYGPGLLQRLYRVPSSTLIYDLQFRLRCKHCNRTGGFPISTVDTRGIGDSSKPLNERVIVEGD